MSKEKYVPSENEIETAEKYLDDSDLTNNIVIGGICAYRHLSEAWSKIYRIQNTPNTLQKQAFREQLDRREYRFSQLQTCIAIILQHGEKDTGGQQAFVNDLKSSDYIYWPS